MRIEETVAADHAILALKGEFDTPYVSGFSEKVDSLAAAGKPKVVLNLRFLRFINSTALGALVKSQKKLRQHGGDLVVSQPSAFCRDLFDKVGLSSIIKIFEDDAEALYDLVDSTRADVSVQDAATVLFSYLDENKKKFAPRTSEIGRIRHIEEDGLQFDWNGAKSGLSNDDIKKLLEPGTDLRLKFQIPLAKKDYFELVGSVQTAEMPKAGIGIRVRTRFKQVSDPDRQALSRFVQDMRFLKNELRQATQG